MDMKYILGMDEGEKPLDVIAADGGFVGIFRTIACIGDSLSSGEFEAVSTLDGSNLYIDRFDYSWGQYIARMAGVKVYNFSRGGMTAKEYMESFANNMGYWQKSLAANAYIVALGVNDIFNRGWEIGDISDIDLSNYKNNKDTFLGHYGAIIQRYREIAPEAPFFLLTTPKGINAERIPLQVLHRDAMYKLAELFPNTYVIDLHEYAPVYDEELRKRFYLRGHMAPAGYLFTAKIVSSYMDYIIRHNFEKFTSVGLMDFDYQR